MIVNPEWIKPKEKPYFNQTSLDCIEIFAEGTGRFNKGEMDAFLSVFLGFMSKVQNISALGNTLGIG